MFEVFAPSTASTKVANDNKSHTQEPIVTGSSIIAVKYDKGVLIALDTVGSYGSLSRFKDIKRITSLGQTLVAADGDISDFQYIERFLKQMEVEEECIGDGMQYSPDEVFHRLTTLMYARRSKVDPLWNNLVVCGVDPNSNAPFIGCTDKIGTPFTADFLATGFGLHMAQPILEDKWKAGLTYEQAKALVVECLKICYYRDCRAGDAIIFGQAEIGKAVAISEKSQTLNSKWDFDTFVNPLPI